MNDAKSLQVTCSFDAAASRPRFRAQPGRPVCRRACSWATHSGMPPRRTWPTGRGCAMGLRRGTPPRPHRRSPGDRTTRPHCQLLARRCGEQRVVHQRQRPFRAEDSRSAAAAHRLSADSAAISTSSVNADVSTFTAAVPSSASTGSARRSVNRSRCRRSAGAWRWIASTLQFRRFERRAVGRRRAVAPASLSSRVPETATGTRCVRRAPTSQARHHGRRSR